MFFFNLIILKSNKIFSFYIYIEIKYVCALFVLLNLKYIIII